jgi:protein FAM32A
MPTVIGGKLKLKGAKPKVAKKDSKTKGKSKSSGGGAEATDTHTEGSSRLDLDSASSSSKSASSADDFLTDTERRHKVKMDELIKNKFAKKLSEVSYRERVEAFNHKLATTTELNDIPRVSAAGNG